MSDYLAMALDAGLRGEEAHAYARQIEEEDYYQEMIAQLEPSTEELCEQSGHIHDHELATYYSAGVRLTEVCYCQGNRLREVYLCRQ